MTTLILEKGEQLPINKELLRLSYDIKHTSKKQFGVLKSIEEINSFCELIESKDLNAYEDIRAFTNTKPYIDCDKKIIYEEGTDYDKVVDNHIKITTNWYLKAFNKLYDTIITTDDILIKNSSRKIGNQFKISFHIIIQNQVYYPNHTELNRALVNKLIKIYENEKNEEVKSILTNNDIKSGTSKCVIDKCVYGSKQNIRLLNQSKSIESGTDKSFRIYGKNWNYQDTFITLYEGVNDRKPLPMLSSINKTEKPIKLTKEQKLIQEQLEYFENTDTEENDFNLDHISIQIKNKTLYHKHNLSFCELRQLSRPLRLLYLISNDNLDYETYSRIGMALKSFNIPYKEYDLWCQLSLKYATNGTTKTKTEDRYKNYLMRGETDKLLYGEKYLYQLAVKCNASIVDKVIPNYKQLHELKDLLTRQTDYQLSKYIRDYFIGEKIVCADRKEQIFYQFKNHKWNNYDKTKILSLTNEKGIEYLNEYRRSALSEIKVNQSKIDTCMNEDLLEDTENDELKEYKQQLNNITLDLTALNECIVKLETTHIKMNILTELITSTYDTDFMDKLDCVNPYLFVCNNCVIDIERSEIREGKLTDFCSLSSNSTYREPSNTEIKEVENFLRKIMPNEERYDFLLNHLASSLIGKNINQFFIYYTGSGSNGKSTLSDLMKMTIGDYFGCLNSNFLTEQVKIGGTCSEVYSLIGKRYVLIPEAEKNSVMKVDKMKSFTGGDTITVREIYKPSRCFVPSFNLAMSANYLIPITSNDDGTWRRISLIEFVSKFIDNVKDVNEIDHIFLKDKTIVTHFKRWSEVLLFILIQIAFKTKGIYKQTPTIKKDVDKYRYNENRVGAVINELFEKTENKTDKLSKRDVFDTFKSYYEMKFGRCIKGDTLFTELNEVYDFHNNYYYCIKQKQIEYTEYQTKEELFMNAFMDKYQITEDPNDYLLCSVVKVWAVESELFLQKATIYDKVLETNGIIKSRKRIAGKLEYIYKGVK